MSLATVWLHLDFQSDEVRSTLVYFFFFTRSVINHVCDEEKRVGHQSPLLHKAQ